jgi:DNA-binding XRE family transcriptional regulator
MADPQFDDTAETALLRAARAMLGLRQDELAQRAGITRQMVLRIEKGDLSVSVRSTLQVKNALIEAGAVFIPQTADWPAGVGRRRRADIGESGSRG